MQDSTLLTQYARTGSQAAFSQLLARHLPLVYRTCRRELGADTLAEDAAQVVFLLLARKAKTLRAAPSLAGWLYQTSVFVAKDIRKQEARRTRREEAVMQETLHAQTAPASEWDTVEPHLNAALSALKPADRDAVLLHFLEGHTLAETGALLGVSEDAARMRVSRALEKLRRHLTAQRASITGAVLTGFLASEAARPVPVHAVNVITQGVLQATSGAAGPLGLHSGLPGTKLSQLAQGVLLTMKIKTSIIAAVAIIFALTAGGVAYKQWHQRPAFTPQDAATLQTQIITEFIQNDRYSTNEVLTRIANRQQNAYLRQVMLQIKADGINAGTSPEDGFDKRPDVFDAHFRSVLRQAGKSGSRAAAIKIESQLLPKAHS